MKNFSGFLTFRVDSSLSQELRKSLDLLLSHFKEATTVEYSAVSPVPHDRLVVDFISENSLHLIVDGPSFKICLLDKNQGLFSFGQNIEQSLVDAILDDGLDIHQIQNLIGPKIQELIRHQEDSLYQIGSKNIRKFESRAKAETTKSLDEGRGLTSENLLAYAQSLVDLEKELIHAADSGRIQKVLKLF